MAATRTPCFAYGSNGTAQLRERCKNPALESLKAAIHNYRRFFTGVSKKWADEGRPPGGVASLASCPGHMCKGSVVYLSDDEYNMLDRFEGIPEGADPWGKDYAKNRYARVWVEVDVWQQGAIAPETVRAIAYIRNKTAWEGMPSTRYLTACYKNMIPFWPELDRYGKLLVYDEAGELHAEFAGDMPRFDTGAKRNKTFLGRLARMKYDASPKGAAEAVIGSRAIPQQHPKCHLYVGVCVYGVEGIDPVEGTVVFNYRVYLFMEANEPALAPFVARARANGGVLILDDDELKAVGAATMIPAVSVYNCVEEPTVHDAAVARVFAPSLAPPAGGNADVARDGIARAWIMWNAQLSCKVRCRYKLFDFPFDSQSLKLDLKILQSKHNEKFELILCEVQYHNRACDMSEWRICEPRVVRVNAAQSTAIVPVQRVHEYYVFNVCCLLCGLTALSTLAFTCELRGNGERLGVNMTLLLTAVAFKQLIAESLPKVSYLTILDKWMLWCLLVLFLSSIACVVPSAFADDERAETVNWWCAVVTAIATIVFLPGYLVAGAKGARTLAPVVVRVPKGQYPWHVWDYTPIWFLLPTKKEEEAAAAAAAEAEAAKGRKRRKSWLPIASGNSSAAEAKLASAWACGVGVLWFCFCYYVVTHSCPSEAAGPERWTWAPAALCALL